MKKCAVKGEEYRKDWRRSDSNVVYWRLFAAAHLAPDELPWVSEWTLDHEHVRMHAKVEAARFHHIVRHDLPLPRKQLLRFHQVTRVSADPVCLVLCLDPCIGL